jgi:hypothetical protein
MQDLTISRQSPPKARKPAMVMLRREAGGTDFGDVLARTTLLVLGAAADDLRDYRIWAEELGGTALQIGSEYALADWLDRNAFLRTAVLIDDPSLGPREAMRIAAEIRLQRPDVAVTLLAGPSPADTAPPRALRGLLDLLPAQDDPGYAVFHRPLGRAAFARAMASAWQHVRIDRETRHHIGGRPRPVPSPTDVFYDETGPRSGFWIGPLILLGAAFWIGLAMIAF